VQLQPQRRGLHLLCRCRCCYCCCWGQARSLPQLVLRCYRLLPPPRLLLVLQQLPLWG
jgi:hypothetical protein